MRTIIFTFLAFSWATFSNGGAVAASVSNSEGRYILASLMRFSDSLSDCLASSQGILAGNLLAAPLATFGQEKAHTSEFKPYTAEFTAMRRDVLFKLAELLNTYNLDEPSPDLAGPSAFVAFAKE